MKHFIRILFISIIAKFSYSQTHNVYFLGHSLVNFDMPEMFKDLCADAGIAGHQQAVTVGNGANLSWQWTNPQTAQGPQYTTELATASHDVFVMTEAVPLKNHLQWSNTHQYADSFHTLAQQYVPNCQTYIYETWHCTTTGTPNGCPWDNDDALAWRPRLTADLPSWEGIPNAVNVITSGPPMLVVPAGQCFARLYDSIAAGAFLPTYDTITDLFSDDIHMNDIGNYFVALVMYATIYKDNPVGLTNQTYMGNNQPYNAPSVAHAAKMQQIVWDVLCAYAHDGVNCNASDITNNSIQKNNFTVYPNPTNGENIICKWQQNEKANVKIELMDITGRVIKSCLNTEINKGENKLTIPVAELAQGIYFIKLNVNGNEIISKFIKN